MYFVETARPTLQSLFNGSKDTIRAYILYTTGGPCNFREYLRQKIKFDSTLLTVQQENHLGQQYEDTIKFFWKYGVIGYVKSTGYKLKKQYKTLFFGDRTKLIVLEDYISVETFISELSSQKLKRKFSKSS